MIGNLALLVALSASAFVALAAQESRPLAAPTAPTLPAPEAPTLVVRGGRLFDPERGASRALGQLWIRDGRVLGEHAVDSKLAPDVAVVDASDGTVLPGLFDLHTHVGVAGGGMTSMLQLTPQENLETQLACGVTNVVDLHGDESMIFALRDRSRTERSLARLWTAGAAFTAPGGHATQFGIQANEVASAEDVGKRLGALLAHKPDLIKVVLEHGKWGGLAALPTLDAELVQDLVGRAHAAGLRAFCHIWTRDEALTAARAGVDALAHGVFLGAVDAELIAAMKEHGTAYVPTLAVVLATAHLLQKKPPYAHDLTRDVLHPELVEALNDATANTLLLSPMARLARNQEPVYLASLKAVSAAGLEIGVGTDAGNPLVPHGPALLFELELYVAAGLTPAQALRAATLGSARVLGVADRFGSLVPGKTADLVVVRGDPAERITDLWNVRTVVKAGAIVDREPVFRRNRERARPAVVLVAGTDVPLDVLEWGGTFAASTDAVAPGGASTSAVECPLVAGKRLVRARGELREGFKYGTWSGVRIVWDPDRKRLVDVSRHQGLRLRVRGTPRTATLTMQCAAVKDFNYFTAPVQVEQEWREVEVPFTALQQIGFGRTVAWTGKDIQGFNLEFRNPPFGKAENGSVELEIEWLRLY